MLYKGFSVLSHTNDRITLEIWLRTVFSLMKSVSAISFVVLSCTRSSNTSLSRIVRSDFARTSLTADTLSYPSLLQFAFTRFRDTVIVLYESIKKGVQQEFDIGLLPSHNISIENAGSNKKVLDNRSHFSGKIKTLSNKCLRSTIKPDVSNISKSIYLPNQLENAYPSIERFIAAIDVVKGMPFGHTCTQFCELPHS